MTIIDAEPIPEIGTVDKLVKPELPENITRLMDAVDSAWSEQITLIRLLNSVNYTILERDGVATMDEMMKIQHFVYETLRYSGYIEQQLRYTLYIMGHDVSHTVTSVPVVKPEVTTE